MTSLVVEKRASSPKKRGDPSLQLQRVMGLPGPPPRPLQKDRWCWCYFPKNAVFTE